jgi:hypothetical protein
LGIPFDDVQKRHSIMRTLLSIGILSLTLSSITAGGTATLDHAQWDAALKRNVSSSGLVNYTGFKFDADFREYLLTLEGTHPDNSWSKNEKMAYWINAYNAFTVKLIVDNLPLSSIKDIDGPWDKEFIQIEGNSYSLNDIEHKILRPVYKDPRIHFAVNCASGGCPPLLNGAFKASSLNAQLEKVTRAFVNNKAHNQISEGNGKLSEIFNWFNDDFKSKGGVVAFINSYSTVKMNDGASLSYYDYDWSLNGK